MAALVRKLLHPLPHRGFGLGEGCGLGMVPSFHPPSCTDVWVRAPRIRHAARRPMHALLYNMATPPRTRWGAGWSSMAAQKRNAHNRLHHRGSGLGEGSSVRASEAEGALSKSAGPQTHASLPLQYGVVFPMRARLFGVFQHANSLTGVSITPRQAITFTTTSIYSDVRTLTP